MQINENGEKLCELCPSIVAECVESTQIYPKPGYTRLYEDSFLFY